MPPAKSLCQCLFKILSAGFIFLPHFYCLPRPKFLRSESFFFSALSSQTLLLIKQINIWSRGVSTRTQPSQPGDLSDQQSWIQLDSLGERNYLSSDKIFFNSLKQISAGKYSPNLTSLGDGKYTAMTNFMTVSFFLLDASIRMFFQRKPVRSWGLVLSEVLRSQGMWFIFFLPFLFFWSQSRERRQAMKEEVSNEVISYAYKHTLQILVVQTRCSLSDS